MKISGSSVYLSDIPGYTSIDPKTTNGPTWWWDRGPDTKEKEVMPKEDCSSWHPL